MKLNLGCGSDIRAGYMNVDFRSLPGVDVVWDLSRFPWPLADESVNEVLMLDFLEHFPHAQTELLLGEVWRVLKPGGRVEIQVPDLEHCARAACMVRPFLCNGCGWKFPEEDFRVDFFICNGCGKSWTEIALAATKRLYGGQDYQGNWHQTAFSPLLLRELLYRNGFDKFKQLELEHQYVEWNFKAEAIKKGDAW